MDAIREGFFDGGTRVQRPEHDKRGYGRASEFGSDVRGNNGEAQDADIEHLPAVTSSFEVVAAKVPKTQVHTLARHGSDHVIVPFDRLLIAADQVRAIEYNPPAPKVRCFRVTKPRYRDFSVSELSAHLAHVACHHMPSANHLHVWYRERAAQFKGKASPPATSPLPGIGRAAQWSCAANVL